MRDLNNLNKEHGVQYCKKCNQQLAIRDNNIDGMSEELSCPFCDNKKICKTVKELINTLNHCCYLRVVDIYGGQVYVCNLCGQELLSMQDVIDHLRIFHENDIIPDVDPTK